MDHVVAVDKQELVEKVVASSGLDEKAARTAVDVVLESMPDPSAADEDAEQDASVADLLAQIDRDVKASEASLQKAKYLRSLRT
jgi:uncharacterized protein (DUF2267 family)